MKHYLKLDRKKIAPKTKYYINNILFSEQVYDIVDPRDNLYIPEEWDYKI